MNKVRSLVNPSPKHIQEFRSWIFGLQDTIVAGLHECEEGRLVKHPWEKDDSKHPNIILLFF